MMYDDGHPPSSDATGRSELSCGLPRALHQTSAPKRLWSVKSALSPWVQQLYSRRQAQNRCLLPVTFETHEQIEAGIFLCIRRTQWPVFAAAGVAAAGVAAVEAASAEADAAVAEVDSGSSLYGPEWPPCCAAAVAARPWYHQLARQSAQQARCTNPIVEHSGR